jgi:hypothetical protein
LATRYEKRAANYHTMWLIAATILWLGVLSTLQTRPRQFGSNCLLLEKKPPPLSDIPML